MERIELLKSWIADEPNDPFNYYALALEHQKLASSETTLCFEVLLDKFPEYLPTYYTAAKYFEEVDATKTRQIYEAGIALALQQNNTKALNELKVAYQNFLFED